MTLEETRDLGHGVRVVPGDRGGTVVLSEQVDLGWRPRQPGRPGSAVFFAGEAFEVVERQSRGTGFCWVLEPWSGEDVMRVVVPLDESSVAGAAAAQAVERRTQRIGPMLWVLLPLLGFADGESLRRWRDEWGFPAVTATWLSGVVELLFAAACLIETIASLGAGAELFPWIPRPLVYCGFYFFAEGIVRLARVSADSEPVGSLLGAVVMIFRRPRPTGCDPLPGPVVESFDGSEGVLKLRSPIVRRDWEEPGLLPFRGDGWALESMRQLGESWIYVFRMVGPERDPAALTLRLPPPLAQRRKPVRDDRHGLVKTVLLNIACTVAPARFQERWAWWAGVKAARYTVVGAGFEIFGGLFNLSSETDPGTAALLLNLFFVVEGAVRLGWLALRGGPMGSVFGLPLSPLLDRVLPE